MLEVLGLEPATSCEPVGDLEARKHVLELHRRGERELDLHRLADLGALLDREAQLHEAGCPAWRSRPRPCRPVALASIALARLAAGRRARGVRIVRLTGREQQGRAQRRQSSSDDRLRHQTCSRRTPRGSLSGSRRTIARRKERGQARRLTPRPAAPAVGRSR